MALELKKKKFSFNLFQICRVVFMDRPKNLKLNSGTKLNTSESTGVERSGPSNWHLKLLVAHKNHSSFSNKGEMFHQLAVYTVHRQGG